MKIYLKEPRPCTSGYEPVMIFGQLMERRKEKIQIEFDYFYNIQCSPRYVKNAFDKILELSGIKGEWEWEDDKIKTIVKTGYVYFIQNGDLSQVKIGWSITPLNRIKELQTGNPNHLKLLAVQPALDQGVEHYLHHRFKKYLINSEWYRFADKIKDYINNEKNILILEGYYI